ncbi:MAG: lipopolysaccharide kinase InaA family protein [Planctomycetota bacterium]|nr:lipopolysaccharide kinase InaA family protein [Planctomycetota bacterium]
MQRVVFSDSWDRFFAEFDIATFDDFFERLAVNAKGGNSRRNVVSFSLGPDARKKTFFIKRFFRPHFKDMIFSRRNIGESCSQGRYEWENARFLIDNGIESYKPVCYGEKTTWGIETKSFVVTEELQAECLSDFVRDKWNALERQEQEKIVAGMGAFIRRIHTLSVSLPDLYVYHIYLTENAGGEYDFAVIDLHRMSRNVTNRNQKIKNLGRLHHSMLDEYFDDELKQLLIKSYATDNWDGDVAALVARVEKHSDTVSAKRKKKAY